MRNRIRIARGNVSNASNDVKAEEGVPFYDTTNKRLYIGKDNTTPINQYTKKESPIAFEADNVSKTINGNNITDIFEAGSTPGSTTLVVKDATNAVKATSDSAGNNLSSYYCCEYVNLSSFIFAGAQNKSVISEAAANAFKLTNGHVTVSGVGRGLNNTEGPRCNYAVNDAFIANGNYSNIYYIFLSYLDNFTPPYVGNSNSLPKYIRFNDLKNGTSFMMECIPDFYGGDVNITVDNQTYKCKAYFRGTYDASVSPTVPAPTANSFSNNTRYVLEFIRFI